MPNLKETAYVKICYYARQKFPTTQTECGQVRWLHSVPPVYRVYCWLRTWYLGPGEYFLIRFSLPLEVIGHWLHCLDFQAQELISTWLPSSLSQVKPSETGALTSEAAGHHFQHCCHPETGPLGLQNSVLLPFRLLSPPQLPSLV